MRTGLLALACCLALSGPASAQSSEIPAFTDASICRPEFNVDGARYRAGTAFLLQTEQRTLLVTAQHLFGPDGGAAADVPASEVPARVRMDVCVAFDGGARWRAETPLAIEGARPGFDENAMRDVAAFPVAGRAERLPVLRLASQPPAVGEAVWLVAQTIGEPSSSALLHRGVVAALNDSALVFVYDAPISITATSGAPIVNARGEVVGVNYGGGEDAGRYIGLATGLGSVRTALASR
jgi:hypothetical protein